MLSYREQLLFVAALAFSIAINQATQYSKVSFPVWSVWAFAILGLISFLILHITNKEND